MKPDNAIPLEDRPGFRFVFFGAITGFLIAALVCVNFVIQDVKVALGLAFASVVVCAGAGLLLHRLYSRFERAGPSTFLLLIGLNVVGLVVVRLGMEYSVGIDLLHSFCWCLFLGMLCLGIVFFVWLLNSLGNIVRTRFETKMIRRKLRYQQQLRRKARYKRSVDLNKKDYSTRLSQFVTNTQSLNDVKESDEPFVSRMPFWQRSPFQIGKLPKPVDLIRVLLHRISKAVYQGKRS